MTDVDVVLLTEDRYEELESGEGANGGMPEWYVQQILREDELLQGALEALGLRVERVSWRRDVDWRRYRGALLRTTWDYSQRREEFEAWLRHVVEVTTLFNSHSLVQWNFNKSYLSELANRGIRTVPQQVVDSEGHVALPDILVARGWDEVVVKPQVSAAGRDTFRVSVDDASSLDEKFQQSLEREAMLVQPFQRSILEDGELSLVVIDGTTTHAVRKRAKEGDFRVQDDHGGSVHEHQPSPEEAALAEAAVQAVAPENEDVVPLYGRVDMVRDNDGELSVMELELIEPELFLRLHPPAAEALAAALQKRLP